MVRFGFLLDLSHMGANTANDVMDNMETHYPGVPFVYRHLVPAGLCKNEPGAMPRKCCRAIPDDQAIRAAESGGYVFPAFTEWMSSGLMAFCPSRQRA